MPVYEYACPDCGHNFEKLQKFTDEAIKVCPNCKKRRVHKVMPRIAVAFKGTGFYVNDSKNGSSSKSETKKPETETKTESTETKTETPATESKTETPKPEAKTETKSETKKETKSEGKAKKSATK